MKTIDINTTEPMLKEFVEEKLAALGEAWRQDIYY